MVIHSKIAYLNLQSSFHSSYWMGLYIFNIFDSWLWMPTISAEIDKRQETLYIHTFPKTLIHTVLVDIERHSQLECHETYFIHTMVIFGRFSFICSAIKNKKLQTMTIVSSLKLLKMNRTPAFYIHQYGSQNSRFG